MPPVAEPGFCQLLDWDSHFFGMRVGRLTLPRLTPEVVPGIFAWCQAHQIACLYFLADADHSETTQIAAEYGFRLVDVRMTLEHRCLPESAPSALSVEEGIRPFGPRDLSALRDLAGRSHRDSRFFFDPHFPAARSRQLFETWIEKSCNNDRDQVFVAEVEGKAAGYITCQFVNEQTGRIGLLGLDATVQGRGIGTRLVRTALGWFAAHGANRVTVVTQGRNIRAQRLYQRCGFVTAAFQLWYHRWF
jgi:dTDP-4-amino-4,6-dideoxy-D-galactose acyltransferase